MPGLYAQKEIGKVSRELWLGLGKKGNRRGERETVGNEGIGEVTREP